MQGAPLDRIDLGRLSTAHARFLPHTNRSAIAPAGGVAIEMHCRPAEEGAQSNRVSLMLLVDWARRRLRRRGCESVAISRSTCASYRAPARKPATRRL